MPPIDSKIERRISKLEEAMESHLMESGAIRTDIAWIKRGVYACVAAALTCAGSLFVGVVLALIRFTR